MTTSDGVRLDADVYRPQAPGEFPVLLMRQPYGRRIASTVTLAHPSWYASNGYIVVIQDVRGRGSSEGRFRIFADDVRDGGETVAWAARLPGSNGRVGMYGFSYQGHTQLLALAAQPRALMALCPAMVTWDVYADWAYEGGAFALLNGLYWGVQMATEQSRLAGNERAFNALFAASRQLPLNAPASCRPAVMDEYRQYCHYLDWINHPRPGSYWEGISVGSALAGKPLDIPMLHLGGWYDFMLGGTLRVYREALARSRTPQKLIIGPWTHIPWGRRIGSADFGLDSMGEVDALQVAWFDRFLKGVDNGIEREPGVRLFDLVAKRWRSFDAWPEPVAQSFFTVSDGLAAVTGHGSLAEAPPSRPVVDTIVHDPWRPVPSIGGHNAELAGMQDRATVDNRADVLTYTSAPLQARVTLAGEVTLRLALRADQTSCDVSAVLSRVTPDGMVFNLTQGQCRVDRPFNDLIRVGMRATCATLQAGDAFRLSLAGSSFPAFPVNPGTGADPAEMRQIDNRTITLTVISGGANATCLDLPIVDAG
jgi:putative CocE/NonD family hydrolase